MLSWGDIVVRADLYGELVDRFASAPCDVLLAVNPTDDPWRGAAISVDDDWRVTSLVEKPPRGTTQTRWNNAGIFVFTPLVLAYAERLTPSARGEYELPQAIAAMINDGRVVRAHAVGGFWSDLGTPEDLVAAEKALATQSGHGPR
jgi:dTDP-glucose pyrophosphorylase